jgi:hypothetical protein
VNLVKKKPTLNLRKVVEISLKGIEILFNSIPS